MSTCTSVTINDHLYSIRAGKIVLLDLLCIVGKNYLVGLIVYCFDTGTIFVHAPLCIYR